MDSDLTRLCAIPGTHDLSIPEVAADVLQISPSSMHRIIRSGKMEVKRHEGRGRCALRVRIPRASIVRYLVRISSGDRTVILSAVAAQCPHYLPAVRDLMAGSAAHHDAASPSNVIPMPRKRRSPPEPFPDHPRLFA